MGIPFAELPDCLARWSSLIAFETPQTVGKFGEGSVCTEGVFSRQTFPTYVMTHCRVRL
mgnify:CR=1 FL=1